MKASIFRLIVAIVTLGIFYPRNVESRFDAIRNEFNDMKDDLPMNIIEDLVNEQNSLIDIFASFNDYHTKISPNLLKLNETKAYEAGGNQSFAAEVHSDVVFVGFPASAVESIREKWFEPLTRSDNVMASIGKRGEVLSVPGGVYIRHHFHLVQISFHVVDSLRKRASLLLRPSGIPGDDSKYINTWEFEEFLEGLATAVSATHKHHVPAALDAGLNIETKEVSPTDTIFVLNLGLADDGAPVKYYYLNGFSNKDIADMAADPDIQKLASDIVAKTKRSSRVDYDIASNVAPINDVDAAKHKYEHKDPESLQQVHWRDAVKETRDWSKQNTGNWESGDSSEIALKARFQRILNANEGSTLARHKLSLAAAILESSATEAHTKCSTATVVGANRLIWRDLHTTASPPLHRAFGYAPSEPAPRELDESEWLRLATASAATASKSSSKLAQMDSAGLITAARGSINRHLDMLKNVYLQSTCSASSMPFEENPSKFETKLEFIKRYGNEIVRNIGSKRISASCGSILLQAALLRTALASSEDQETMASKWLSSPSVEDVKDYITDATSMHSMLLDVALEASNPLLEASSGQLHSGRATEQVTVYLGHLTGFILRAVRYLVTPPLALRIDPKKGYHEGSYSDWRDSSLVEATEFVPSLEVALEMTDEEQRIDAKLFGSSHAYNGETLFELTSADLNYYSRHRRDRITNLARRLVEMQWDRELAVWNTLLPAVLFPTKINVVVYVIKLHNAYEPLGQTVGSSTGFDITTYMREIARLRLPNQLMSITIQVVDQATLTGEKGLGLGLASCRREGVLHGHTSTMLDSPVAAADAVRPHFYQYLDSGCLWTNLHPYDEKIHDRKKFKNEGSNVDDPSMTHHLPVFLVSVDTPDPTYLIGMKQSAAFGDAVFIMQNRQSKVDTKMKCASVESGAATAPATTSAGTIQATRASLVRAQARGRNPVSSALLATAEAIGGMAGAHVGHRGLPTSPSLTAALTGRDQGHFDVMEVAELTHGTVSATAELLSYRDLSAGGAGFITRDWSSFLGESPTFEAAEFASYSLPTFTTLELENIHRGRVLRSLSLSHALIESFNEKNPTKTGSQTALSEKVHGFIKQALAAVALHDWPAAASFANAAFTSVQSLIVPLDADGVDPSKRQHDPEFDALYDTKSIGHFTVMWSFLKFFWLPVSASAAAYYLSAFIVSSGSGGGGSRRGGSYY